MNKSMFSVSFIIAILAISALNIRSDEGANKPSIIKGKIWGGSDTLEIKLKSKPDTSVSMDVDTTLSDEKLNWSSDDVIILEERNISEKTGLLKLKLSVPKTLKFIENAPVRLAAESSDPDIVEVGTGFGDDPKKGFTFPLAANPGTADILLYYRVVCCTTGPDSACFFKEAKLKVPVTVGEFENDFLEIRYRIED